LVLFLVYEVLKIWYYREKVTGGVVTLAVIVALIIMWFMLERIGLIPKID